MAEKQYSSRTITMVSIVVLVVLIALIWPLSRTGKGSTSAGSADEVELRIQPVARVEMQKAAAAKSDGKARDGATVYKAVCVACHGTGVAGAPKTGDKAAWAPRMATGMAALLKSATTGKGAMPPRGGAADLTDAELKAAVEYLTSQAK
jgi:cytochrome c5